MEKVKVNERFIPVFGPEDAGASPATDVWRWGTPQLV